MPRDLDAFIAQAADTWLADPADVAAYARLVAAVQARRAHLASGAVRAADDISDDTGAHPPNDVPEVRAVGAELDGDPRAVLHRLRTGLR